LSITLIAGRVWPLTNMIDPRSAGTPSISTVPEMGTRSGLESEQPVALSIARPASRKIGQESESVELIIDLARRENMNEKGRRHRR